MGDNALVCWHKRHQRTLLPALMLALGYHVAITLFRDYQFGIGQNVLRVAAGFVLLVYAAQGLQRRRVVPFAVAGGLFAFFIVAMRTVVTETGPRPWRLWLVLPLVFFGVVYTLLGCGASVLLQRAFLRRGGASAPAAMAQPGDAPKTAVLNATALPSTKPMQPRRMLLVFFVLLVVCWLPVMLVFGPARISPDSAVVISQALGHNHWDDSHPILYTFLVRVFLGLGQALGSLLAGAYLFGAVQLCAVAGVLAFSLYWLHRQGVPLVACGVGLAYFVLTPVFALNAITMWKDIPFNCLLLLLVLALYATARQGGEWLLRPQNAAGFLLLCAGVCFFRGNGVAVVAVCMAALLLCFRRHAGRLALLFVPFLLVVMLIRGPVYATLGIPRLGGVEAAGLPIQQVGRVVAGGAALTPQQAQLIERVVPLEVVRESYQPSSPDYIKKHPQFDVAAFDQNSGALLGLWLQLMPEHLEEYTNAWLLQTLGYWKYDFPPHAAHLEDSPPETGIANKDLLLKATGLNLRGFFTVRAESFLPMGLLFFITLGAAAQLFATGRGRLALGFVPLFTLWLGLMAGAPTYRDLRYMLVYALALPVVLFIGLAGQPAGQRGATNNPPAASAPANATTATQTAVD